MSRRDLLEVSAIAACLACTIVLGAVWFAAAATGNSLTVTVNDYGERNAELVMWTGLVPLIAYGLHVWARPK